MPLTGPPIVQESSPTVELILIIMDFWWGLSMGIGNLKIHGGLLGDNQDSSPSRGLETPVAFARLPFPSNDHPSFHNT